MPDEDVRALASFTHRRTSKTSALIYDFLRRFPEIKSTKKTIKEVLLEIAQKCPHTDEWEVRKKLRKRFALPTAQEEEYAEMQEEWRSKKGKLSGRRAASKEEEDAKEFPKDAIYFPGTGSSFLPFTDAWKALRKHGWSWKNGTGLTSYVYVRTNGKAPSRGGIQNDDYFISEEDAAAYLRSLDPATMQRDIPFLWEWKEQHTRNDDVDDFDGDKDDTEETEHIADSSEEDLPETPDDEARSRTRSRDAVMAPAASEERAPKRHKPDVWRTEDGGWLEHKESDVADGEHMVLDRVSAAHA
eukprot:scaffold1166_cov261-Pinguiococcus_pyrenoidosus.AAC.37